MWLGLLYGVCADPPPRVNEDGAMVKDEDAMVMLFVWEAGRDRPLTVGGPAISAPDMARLLRAAGQGPLILKPRCDACGTSFELPLE